MQIHDMSRKDIPHVQKLWKSVGFDLSLSDTIPELEKMIKHNPGLCLVGLNSDKNLVSTVLGGFDGRRGWIHHLAVHPSFQNQGWGKLMMQELTNRFQKIGVVKLKLEILETNKAIINFYRNLGWDLRTELSTMSLTLKD